MKKLSVTLLVVMVSMTSCAVTQKQEIKPPKTLDDDWGRWLVGEWEGPFESTAGEGINRMEIELCFNGRFLVTKYKNQLPETTTEGLQEPKEAASVPDNDIKKMQDSIYKGLEFRMIDPNSGQVTGQWFDNWRPMFTGISKRKGNKEVMSWEWYEQRILIVRTIEKISDDKFIMTGKWVMPDGSVMDDKTEMTRKKTVAGK